MLLDVPHASVDPDVSITQFPFNGGRNQRWEVVPDPEVSDRFKISPLSQPKLVLDIQGASTGRLAPLIQWNDKSEYTTNQEDLANQRFHLKPVNGPFFCVESVRSGLALTVPEPGIGSRGAAVVQDHFESQANQMWQFVLVGVLPSHGFVDHVRLVSSQYPNTAMSVGQRTIVSVDQRFTVVTEDIPMNERLNCICWRLRDTDGRESEEWSSLVSSDGTFLVQSLAYGDDPNLYLTSKGDPTDDWDAFDQAPAVQALDGSQAQHWAFLLESPSAESNWPTFRIGRPQTSVALAATPDRGELVEAQFDDNTSNNERWLMVGVDAP